MFFWRDKVPREVAIHQRIEKYRDGSSPGHDHLIRCSSHRLMMQKRRFRLYLEFCELGSLYDATKELFTQWEKFYESVGLDWLADEPEDNVSEAYIWHVFKVLVDACLVLQRGRSDNAVPETGWDPIVHGDITLRNVFLARNEDVAHTKVSSKNTRVSKECHSQGY